MKTKFCEFDTLLESAINLNTGGGFKENTPVKLTPAFFASKYFKEVLSSNPMLADFLKAKHEQDYFFFIKQVVSPRGGNDSEKGVNPLFLKLRTDPRGLNSATENNEFDIPASLEFVEVLNFGPNLPPLQSNDAELTKKYGHHHPERGIPVEGPNYMSNTGFNEKGENIKTKNTKLPGTKDPEKWKPFSKK